MKPIITQQEVLVLTGTEFTSRTYQKKGAAETANDPSQKERLKDDCWNGMLNDNLPEAFALADPNAEMYIFQMREEQHFLLLEMGESPLDVDPFYSIDPYHFMTMKFFS
jgi:hypothetical protein